MNSIVFSTPAPIFSAVPVGSNFSGEIGWKDSVIFLPPNDSTIVPPIVVPNSDILDNLVFVDHSLRMIWQIYNQIFLLMINIHLSVHLLLLIVLLFLYQTFIFQTLSGQ